MNNENMKDSQEATSQKKAILMLEGVIVLLLIVIIVLLVVPKINKSQKDLNGTNTQEEKVKETKNENEKINNDESNEMDLDKNDISSKCLNCVDDVIITKYEENNGDKYFKLSSSNNSVTLTINWDSFCEWSFLKECPSGLKEYKIVGIDKKVKSVYVGGAGQTIEGTSFLYLLEDGTIKYNSLFGEKDSNAIINVDHANGKYSFDNPTEFKANGPIKGITNIKKLQGVNISGCYGGGGAFSTIAIRADGTRTSTLIKILEKCIKYLRNYRKVDSLKISLFFFYKIC